MKKIVSNNGLQPHYTNKNEIDLYIFFKVKFPCVFLIPDYIYYIKELKPTFITLLSGCMQKKIAQL